MLTSSDPDLVLRTINSIGTSVFLIDVLDDDTFRVFAINRHEEEDIERRNEEVAGKRLEDFLEEEHAEKLYAYYRQCVRERRTVEFEDSLDSKSVGRRWYRTSLAPLMDETDRVVRLMGTAVEITAHKVAEQSLEWSEERYRSFVARSIDGICRIELDPSLSVQASEEEQIGYIYEHGRLAECNDALAAISGFPNGAMMKGQPFGRMFPRSNPRSLDMMRDFIRSDYRTTEQSWSQTNQTGEIRSIVTNVIGYVSDDRLLGAWVTTRDVTRQQAAEAEIRKRQKMLEQAEAIAKLGSFEWDAATNEVAWSEELLHIYGLTPEKFEPSFDHYIDRLHPDDRERIRSTIESAFRRAESFATEERIVRPDGTLRQLTTKGEVIANEHGEPVGVIGACQDVTEQRAMEEELARKTERLRRYGIELEHRVQERTRELAIAKEQAEDADRLKSAFLAAMSHELRTPLNSIIGFTGILLQGMSGELNEEQCRQLGIVRESGSHLLSLINDVLDISKIEAGRVDIVTHQFDLRDAIEKSVATVMPLAAKKGIVLSATSRIEPLIILSDRRRVEQVLINLLGNAIKFTERGSVELAHERVNDEVVIRVVDTGIGIEPEDRAAVFDSFHQVDSGIRRHSDGSGLGLSISKKLVEMLGGRIWLESEPGVGSTFGFALPLEEASHDSHKRRQAEDSADRRQRA